LDTRPKEIWLNNKKLKSNWDIGKKIITIDLNVNKENRIKIIL